MSARREFKRLILGLHQSAPDRSTVSFAVELAELLRLDLFGLYIEEPSLKDIGAFPFVREFRTLGGQWHPIKMERIAQEFELGALAARRLITQAASTRRISCNFEIVKSQTEKAIAAVSQTTDILILPEPRSAVQRVFDPFPRLRAAAFRSQASVLQVPSRIARTHGPVVAIAASADDPSIPAALAVAAATKENLVIIEGYQDDAPAAAPQDIGLSNVFIERFRASRQSLADARFLLSMLTRFGERLVVMTRGALSADEAFPALIATARHVPVLIVEPGEAQNLSESSERRTA